MAAVATAFVLAAATSATAQYNKTEPPKTRFRVGPLRSRPKLELRNAGRDTNVYARPDGSRSPTPRSSCAAPSRASCRCGRRIRLFGEGWLDWSYFRGLSTESSIDPGGRGRAEVDLGPFTLPAGGGALQARQLYSIDIDERILRQEQWVNGGAEWRISRRFVASGGAEQRTYRYDPSVGPRGGTPSPPRASTATTSPAPSPSATRSPP